MILLDWPILTVPLVHVSCLLIYFLLFNPGEQTGLSVFHLLGRSTSPLPLLTHHQATSVCETPLVRFIARPHSEEIDFQYNKVGVERRFIDVLLLAEGRQT